jgi:hypothetical protein
MTISPPSLCSARRTARNLAKGGGGPWPVTASGRAHEPRDVTTGNRGEVRRELGRWRPSSDRWLAAPPRRGSLGNTVPDGQTAAGVKFRLLGPLEVVLDGERVSIRAARQEIALTMLLLEAGHIVSVDLLIDAILSDSRRRRPRVNSRSAFPSSGRCWPMVGHDPAADPPCRPRTGDSRGIYGSEGRKLISDEVTRGDSVCAVEG